MAAIPGTNVIAPIVPLDTADEYPSHLAAYGKGGYRSVATAADRDAIPALRREAGMLVLTTSDGVVWKLAADLTTWSVFSTGSSGSTAAAWLDITGKPTVFPPAAHAHTTSDITDFSAAVAAAAPATTNAALLTSGTLDAARLPAAVVLTTDSRLSDARNPNPHSHVIADTSGLQAALDGKQAAGSYAAATHTHTAGQISGLADVATSGAYSSLSGRPTLGTAAAAATTDFAAASHTHALTAITQSSATTGQVATWNGSAWAPATPTPPTTSASDLTGGTLSDSRLSSNVVLDSVLGPSRNASSSVIDVCDRAFVGTTRTLTSGSNFYSFFTPTRTVTVSQITMCSSTASSGLTLARMGLYTWDGTTLTLVARTASDTTLFSAGTTAYTRSWDSTGGFASSYTLTAGTRYAVGVCAVGTSPGTLEAAGCNQTVAALSPRVQGVRTGNTDLLTTNTQFNGNVPTLIWARLS